MAEKTEEEDTSGLGDIGQFLTAMRSRYGRVPALKKVGRLIGQWFLGGAVFVVLCIGGEAFSVGFRKAAEMYWRWWVWPPFVIAFVPIAFTLFLAVIQLAAYAVVFPFVIVGELIGYDRSTASKRVSAGLLYLAFAFFVAFCAQDNARRDAAPKPPTKAVAAGRSATSQQLDQPQASAPTGSGHWFDRRTILIAVLAWCGGLAQTTFGSVTSAWAKRLFLDERPEVVLYGPDDKPQ